MEQGEQKVTLYDFLFIDQARIRSLYAQLFSGFLAGMEMLVTDREKSGWLVQGGAGYFAFGNKNHEQEASKSKSEHIDPHDIVLHDVLMELFNRKMICPSPLTACPGNLVFLEGKVGILDFSMMEGITELLTDILNVPTNPGGTKKVNHNHAQKEQKVLGRMLKSFASLVPWGVTVLFQNEELTAWGAIERKELRADPGHMLLRSGPILPGTWYMLALVDVPQGMPMNTMENLPSFSEGLLQGLTAMRQVVGMPDTCIGVTPLLVFRKILSPEAQNP